MRVHADDCWHGTGVLLAGPRQIQRPRIAPSHVLVGVAGICFMLACQAASSTANASQYVPHAPQYQVQMIEVPCNTTDKDMAPLYRDNLLPDLSPWRTGRPLSMSDFDQLVHLHSKPSPTSRVVLIYNNTIFFPSEDDPRVCSSPCDRYMRQGHAAFTRWLLQLPFPNAVFYLNVRDHPRCRTRDECPVPFLSFAKETNLRALKPRKSPFSMPLDILVPKLPWAAQATAAIFPWEAKSNKAVWRGTRWCAGKPQKLVGCARKYLGELYLNSSRARELMDFGYGLGTPPHLQVPRMPAGDAARYKFIINLDGMTAAYRLSRTMLMNSAILKEESIFGEYYYRSLREFEHYIPIFKDNATDILDVIEYWQQPENEPRLLSIIASQQAFAAKYTCPRARMLYWRKAVVEYKRLLPDMDEAIESKWWPMVKRKVQALQKQKQ